MRPEPEADREFLDFSAGVAIFLHKTDARVRTAELSQRRRKAAPMIERWIGHGGIFVVGGPSSGPNRQNAADLFGHY